MKMNRRNGRGWGVVGSRRVAKLRAACLGLGLGLAGCDGETPPVSGRSEVVYLAPGDGPSNAEPLWPLRAGWRTEGGVSYATLDARQVGDRVVIPLTTTVRGAFEMVGAPSEPGFYRYLSSDADGVWLVGQPREGVLGQGALLVPATVRVGMRWESWVGGEKRLAVSVLSRAEEETIFGPRVVWTLRIEDHRRYWFDTSESFDLADAPRKLGAESTLRLAEGRGPLDDVLLGGTGLAPLETGPLRVVVPLADDPVRPVAAPSVTLQPVGGKSGPSAVENFMVVAAGAYPDPEVPGATILAMRGMTPFFGRPSVGGIDGGASGGLTSSEDHQLRCARLVGDSVEPLALGDPRCVPAEAMRVAPGGAQVVLPFFSHGVSLFEQGCNPGMDNCVPRIHHFRGLEMGPDGQPIALAWSPEGRAAPPGAVMAGRYDPDFYIENNLTYPDGATVWGTFMPFLGFRPHGEQRGSGLLKSFWWTRRFDDGAFAVLDVGGEQRDTARIAFSRLDPPPPPAAAPGGPDAPAAPPTPPRTAAEHWVYPATEVRSTVVTAQGATHHLFGYEGLLRRVHIERDGVKLEPVAQIEPTGDDFISAAFVVGDEIIALSQRGFQGVDPWFTPTGIDRSILLKWGDVRVWRAPVPARSSATAPTRPAAVFGLDVAVLDRDVRVCWPPGNGAAPVTGVTLGGVSPAAVVAQGDCVLLVRPPVTDAAELLRPGAWRVEGTLPGVGPVAIGLSPEVWRNQHLARGWDHPRGFELAFNQERSANPSPGLVGAPLTGGGWVSSRGLHGPALISTLDHDTEGRPAADAAGHGLWMYHPAFMGHRVILRGAAGVSKVVDLEPYISPRNLPQPFLYDQWPVPLPGGGVLIGDLKVGPDGAVEVLPQPTLRDPSEGRFVVEVVRANGEACGVLADTDEVGANFSNFACVNAEGTSRHSGEPYYSEGQRWVRVGDVAWTLSQGEAGEFRLLRIDLATLEFGEVPLPEAPPSPYGVVGMRAATHWRSDPSGVIYLIISAERGEHVVYRMEADGPHHVVLPELVAMANSSHLDLVIEADLFLFVSLNHGQPLDNDRLFFNPPDVLRVVRAGR